jgi:hypothetical protein
MTDEQENSSGKKSKPGFTFVTISNPAQIKDKKTQSKIRRQANLVSRPAPNPDALNRKQKRKVPGEQGKSRAAETPKGVVAKVNSPYASTPSLTEDSTNSNSPDGSTPDASIAVSQLPHNSQYERSVTSYNPPSSFYYSLDELNPLTNLPMKPNHRIIFLLDFSK